jgi:hypothetical protein
VVGQILFNILKSRQILETLLKAVVDVYTENKTMIKFYNKNLKLVEINKEYDNVAPFNLHCLMYI